MNLARVRGRTHATVKHESFEGRRLILCSLLGASGEPEGDVLIVVDLLGAQVGDTVLLSSDGKSKTERLNSPQCPARWLTVGIVEEA